MRGVDLRSLRTHPDFRLFFAGQLVSLIGSWMAGVAQAWLVYRLTGSTLTLGAVAFASNLPVLLLSPVAGWVADRYPRRRTVVLTHLLSMAQAAALAALTFSGSVRVEHLFVLAVVFGIANAFEMPARHSMVGDLVGRADVGNAIALNSSMINVTRIVGPAVGGLVISQIGEAWCFLINAASFVAALVTLIRIRVPDRTDARPSRGPVRQVLEGLSYVRSQPAIAGLLLLLGIASLVAMPYAVLLPAFADLLAADRGASALGAFQSSAGLGALIGALLLASQTGTGGLGRVVVMSLMIAGLALIAFAGSRWLPLSMLLLVPVGFGLMRHMAATNTLLQTLVPDELRGRVMSFYSMMLVGLAPFGALAAGALAEGIGARWTVAVFGMMGASGALIALSFLPDLRPSVR